MMKYLKSDWVKCTGGSGTAVGQIISRPGDGRALTDI